MRIADVNPRMTDAFNPNQPREPKGNEKGGEFASKGGGFSEAVAKTVHSDLLYAIGADRLMERGGEHTALKPRSYGLPGYEFAVRDYGRWENPPDKREEEDYDWQELSQESGRQLQAQVDRVQKNNPKAEITWRTGEKNYIEFFIEPKKTKKDEAMKLNPRMTDAGRGNPYHEPKGSSIGGRFAKKTGGSTGEEDKARSRAFYAAAKKKNEEEPEATAAAWANARKNMQPAKPGEKENAYQRQTRKYSEQDAKNKIKIKALTKQLRALEKKDWTQASGREIAILRKEIRNLEMSTVWSASEHRKRKLGPTPYSSQRPVRARLSGGLK